MYTVLTKEPDQIYFSYTELNIPVTYLEKHQRVSLLGQMIASQYTPLHSQNFK